MINIDFPQLLQQLQKGISAIAKQTFKTYASAAASDGKALLNELETQLQLWVQQLEKAELSADDFKYNLATAADLVEMAALKQKGLALIKIDGFKNAVTDLIAETITGLIP